MPPSPTCSCVLAPSLHLLKTPCPAPLVCTPAAQHDLVAYLSLLKTDGRLVLVGLPPEPLAVPAFALTSREPHGPAIWDPAC